MSRPPFEEIAARPGRFDLFRALWRIEAAHPELPALGDALRPADEPVRFAGEPAMDFAPAAISRLEQAAGRVPRLVQRVLGFFGPNGALPIHLTEYARERALHHGDRSFVAFADMLLHRFGLFFYRAWARTQPTVGLGPRRHGDAPIVRQMSALAGLAEPALRGRDALGDFQKLHFAGRLARPVRDADGLEAWIRLRFCVPAEVRQFCGHWMQLDAGERTRLTHHGAAVLGRGAVLGRSVWDVQHKFRIVIGPLPWAEFQAFLPGGAQLLALQAMVRQYLGFEFAWDLQLVLHEPAVPVWSLGLKPAIGRLGRTAWMNRGLRSTPRRTDQLVMNVESIVRAPLGPSVAMH